jgi:hypothetical protein
VDPQVVLQPPPDFVNFGLPAYEELFPNLENVTKETPNEITTSPASSSSPPTSDGRFNTLAT